MNSANKNRFLQKGQTLVEVMVAMTVGMLVLTAITSSVLTSLVNSRVSNTSTEASQYAQQGIEIARVSRTAAAGKYCLDKGVNVLSGVPQGTCATANVDGKYIRTIDIQGNNPNNDCGTGVNKIISTVRWTDSKCPGGTFCHQTRVESCLNVIAQAINITPTAPAPGSPTAVLNATLSTITTGNSTTLSWTSTNAITCTASGGTGWAGAKSASGSVTVSPTSTTTYSLYCTSSLGVNSSTQQRTITVNALPTATINSSPNPITQGGSTTLTWSSTNATGCTASNGWTGAKAASGSQSVSPGTTTTYSIRCTSADGYQSSLVSEVVTVNPLPPTVNLTAATTNLASGGSTTLSWFVTNATSCTKSLDWTGTVAGADGGPTSTGALTTSKDYRMTCTGPGGSDFDDVHISVGKTTVVFYPIEDAYISEQSPNSNFGTSNYLRSGSDGNSANRYNSYLEFDISSLAASRTLVSANFKLTLCRTVDNSLCTGTGASVRLRGASGAWSETTVCWSTSVSPCTARPTNGSTEVTIASGLAQGTAITSDLTTYFSDKLGTTTSLALTTDNAFNGYSMFYSKGATATADRPQLTIVSEL